MGLLLLETIEGLGFLDKAISISKPLGIIGLSVAVAFLVLRLIVKKDIFAKLTKDSTTRVLLFIINRVFYIAIVAMVLGFTVYTIDRLHDTKPTPNKTQLKGNIYMAGGPVENVSVNLSQYEKTDKTSEDGTFLIEFVNYNGLDSFRINLSGKAIQDTLFFLKNELIDRVQQIEVKPTKNQTKYHIVSGQIIDSENNPINDVDIYSIDGNFNGSSDMNGIFIIETIRRPRSGTITFTFFKEGYKKEDRDININTKGYKLKLVK